MNQDVILIGKSETTILNWDKEAFFTKINNGLYTFIPHIVFDEVLLHTIAQRTGIDSELLLVEWYCKTKDDDIKLTLLQKYIAKFAFGILTNKDNPVVIKTLSNFPEVVAVDVNGKPPSFTYTETIDTNTVNAIKALADSVKSYFESPKESICETNTKTYTPKFIKPKVDKITAARILINKRNKNRKANKASRKSRRK